MVNPTCFARKPIGPNESGDYPAGHVKLLEGNVAADGWCLKHFETYLAQRYDFY